MIGHDGQGQMTHFVNDDGFNTFRLPVGWQFLTQDAATGVLNMTNFAEYNALVNVSIARDPSAARFLPLAQACLGTGAFCIVDVHNYARFNGQVRPESGV